VRSSFFRVALIAASLLAVVGASAATSSGSAPARFRPEAPILIAHDTTGAGKPVEVTPLRGHPAAETARPARFASTRVAKDSSFVVTQVPSSAVGMSQVVVAFNTGYQIESRSPLAHTLAWVPNTTFWSGLTGPDAAGLCGTNPQGQPAIAYDWLANRWVISEAAYASSGTTASGPFVECVAVSTSPDATGGWNRYVFQVASTLYPDRQAIGVWGDGYYLSFDQLTSSGGWLGAGVMALERSTMLAGSPSQARYFDLDNVNPGLGGMLPADVSDTTAPASGSPELYLQAHDDPYDSNDRLEVWEFHVDWTSPVTGSTFQPLANLPLASPIDTSFSCLEPGSTQTYWSDCLVQKPTTGTGTQQLTPLSQVNSTSTDDLPLLAGRLQWLTSGGTQTLTAAATVNVGSNVAEPMWFKLTNSGSGWTIGNDGVFNPADGVSRFLPSAGVDGSGNVALAYVATSVSLDPTTAYTEASNSSFGEQVLDPSTTPFTANDTYGRYPTMLSLDPVDQCTFWFTGPYPDADSHGVEEYSIDTFSFPSCTASASQPPLLTGNSSWTAALMREGQTITGTNGSFTGATSTSDQWQRCNASGFDCVDIAGATSSTYTMTAADAAGDRTLRFMEIGTNANGSSDSVSSATNLVQSLPPVNNTLPVISGTTQSGQTLSTTNGTWTSSSPLSFTYRWRRCSSGSCANIAGAVGSTYTLQSADVGTTVDVVVSATNTGGGSDANAAATASITGSTAPPANAPDLKLAGTSSAATPAAGSSITLDYTVTDQNGQAAATPQLTVSLPTGLTYTSSSVPGGSGCAAQSSTQIICGLPSLSSTSKTATAQLDVKVTTAAKQSVAATVSTTIADASPSDNSVVIALNGASSSGTSSGVSSTASVSTLGLSSSGVPVGLNGSPSSLASADKVPPTAHALASTAKRGRVADLKFRIYDNSGTAKAVATVKRGTKQVARAATGFGPVAYGTVYYVGWHVPKKLSPGKYSFCVVAYDRAKHHSATSCAALTVR